SGRASTGRSSTSSSTSHSGGSANSTNSNETSSAADPMRLLLGTRNAAKAREIARILTAAADIELLSLDDVELPYTPDEERIEAFETFRESAAAKARYYAERTGIPTIADDSGLAVDALGGRP